MSHYVLGLDIGDETVAAAVCRWDEGRWRDPVALRLGGGRPLGRAAVELAPDGTVGPVDPRVAPGPRTVQHVMARLGTAVPFYADGRGIHAAEVVAAVVAGVRSAAEAQEGTAPARTVLAVPPSWGPHRRSLLLEAVRSVCPDAGLVSSAVAATYHHTSTGELPPGSVFAVYDLGASSLDTAIVGPAADGSLHHLAPPPAPLPWGGRDIDDAMLGHLLGCLAPPADGAVQPATGAGVDGLRERAVAAKEALTVDTVVCVDLPPPTGPVRVTREELEELVDRRLGESIALTAGTLAGAAEHDPDGVLLVGGAARMPLVAERLSADLGLPVTVGPEPELAAARGAARLAAADLLAAADPLATAPSPEPRVPPPTSRGRAGAARPARSPAGRPPGAPRVQTGPHGNRTVTRALLVTAMFVGLVALMSSLVSVISDVRTAPTAQGQVPTPPNPGAAAVPPGDGAVPPGSAAAAGGSLAEAGSYRAAEVPPPTTGRSGTATRPAPVAPGTTAAVPPGTTAPVLPSPVDVQQPPATPAATPPATTEPPPTTEPPVTTPPTTTVPPVTTEPPVTTPTESPSDPPPVTATPAETPVAPPGDAGAGTGGAVVDAPATDGTTP